MPRVLSHNDLSPKNVHILYSGSVAVPYVFDWEYSAVSSPAVDIACLSEKGGISILEAYMSATPRSRYRMSLDTLQRAAILGGVLRACDGLAWSSTSYSYLSGRSLYKSELFLKRIEQQLYLLGQTGLIGKSYA